MEQLTPRLTKKLKRIRPAASNLYGTLLSGEGRIAEVIRESVWELKERADSVADATNDQDEAAEFFRTVCNLGMDHIP
jgi:hypothetical protein